MNITVAILQFLGPISIQGWILREGWPSHVVVKLGRSYLNPLFYKERTVYPLNLWNYGPLWSLFPFHQPPIWFWQRSANGWWCSCSRKGNPQELLWFWKRIDSSFLLKRLGFTTPPEVVRKSVFWKLLSSNAVREPIWSFDSFFAIIWFTWIVRSSLSSVLVDLGS